MISSHLGECTLSRASEQKVQEENGEKESKEVGKEKCGPNSLQTWVQVRTSNY